MRAHIHVTDRNDSTLLITCLYSPWTIYNWYTSGGDGPVDREPYGQAYYTPGFFLQIVSPNSQSSPYLPGDRRVTLDLFPWSTTIRAGWDGKGWINSTGSGFLATGECRWLIVGTERMGWTSDKMLPETP